MGLAKRSTLGVARSITDIGPGCIFMGPQGPTVSEDLGDPHDQWSHDLGPPLLGCGLNPSKNFKSPFRWSVTFGSTPETHGGRTPGGGWRLGRGSLRASSVILRQRRGGSGATRRLVGRGPQGLRDVFGYRNSQLSTCASTWGRIGPMRSHARLSRADASAWSTPRPGVNEDKIQRWQLSRPGRSALCQEASNLDVAYRRMATMTMR